MRVFALSKTFSAGGYFLYSPISARVERDVKILRVKTCLFADDYDKIKAEIESANADSKIRSILIDFDSDGGAVFGAAECAEIIRGSQKQVVGYVSGVAASAAYWLLSACHKIVAHKSSVVGSIGVYCYVAQEKDGKNVVSTLSPNKLTDINDPQSVARFQSHLDSITLQFQTAIAAYRGTDLNRVQTTWGQGDVLSADDGSTQGMVDSIGNFKDALAIANAASIGQQSPAIIARRVGAQKTREVNMKFFALKKSRAEMTPEENAEAQDITVDFVKQNAPDVFNEIMKLGQQEASENAKAEAKETEEMAAMADETSEDEKALVSALRAKTIAVKDFPMALLMARKNPSDAELKRRAQGGIPANPAVQYGMQGSNAHRSGDTNAVSTYAEAIRAQIKALRQGARRTA